jgi:hypothetical protein
MIAQMRFDGLADVLRALEDDGYIWFKLTKFIREGKD